MDEAARRFARKLLLLHLLLLAVVVMLVYTASHEVYASFRDEALHAAGERQELLAAQTGGAIADYYASILSDLDLLRRTPSDQWVPNEATGKLEQPPNAGAQAWALAPALWMQLKDRVSHLFAVDRATLGLWRSFPEHPDVPAAQIVKNNGDWLRQVTDRAVSPMRKIGSTPANLLCVTAGGGRLLLVAVVPVREVDSRFLNKLNSPSGKTSAMLIDAGGTVMASSQRRVLGRNLVQDMQEPQLRALTGQSLQQARAATHRFETPVTVGGVRLGPALTTVYPVRVADSTWWVIVSSSLASVDDVVGRLFSRAIWWAAFVIVSMTAILVSTFIVIVRSRSKMERIRHEMLSKEVDQAREIQLAWLPPAYEAGRGLDIAAINYPAQHVSGDFYNWFDLPDGRVVVAIGDVTGHGMSGAFLMATTQLLVRTTMLRLQDPGKTLEEVNRQLCQQMFNGQFVTMLIVVLDPARGEMAMATAGHYPPLMGDGGEFQPVALAPQLVLGIEKGIQFPTQRFDLPPSATLLLYTDGVLDAQSPTGERFSHENLEGSLHGSFASAQEVIDRVVASITQFRGSRDLPDDLTMVAIQLQPEMAGRELAAVAGGG